ncbi:DUF7504 family protein [Halorientalis pallida]|uniref:Uncharacterized protein n=1 Tax=Halorientalis pallida TaxID=2479928 RepID=A0A498L4V2_9EURY|nr:hypothetical protein [Halorientalis pallida]RXK51282.1 hypothetical protein EAF64_01175 [Halorientalis pallida]
MSKHTPAKAGNLLVMAPAMSDDKAEQCHDLLSGQAPESVDLVRIVYHRSPDRLVDEWADRVGDPPANTVIVSVDDRAQSGSIGGQTLSGEADGTVEVLAANPNDLTGLGMELNNALTALSETDNEVYVCFDSVTAMLQFVDTESAYKFLHMLTGQFHKVDAVAHFHLDPTAHDERTISRIKTTFDDMVEL